MKNQNIFTTCSYFPYNNNPIIAISPPAGTSWWPFSASPPLRPLPSSAHQLKYWSLQNSSSYKEMSDMLNMILPKASMEGLMASSSEKVWNIIFSCKFMFLSSITSATELIFVSCQCVKLNIFVPNQNFPTYLICIFHHNHKYVYDITLYRLYETILYVEYRYSHGYGMTIFSFYRQNIDRNTFEGI